MTSPISLKVESTLKIEKVEANKVIQKVVFLQTTMNKILTHVRRFFKIGLKKIFITFDK